jgi:hypothetical protein
MKKNWAIYGSDGIPITATSTSAVTLIGTDDTRLQAEDVMIDNPGSLDVYVKAGPVLAGLAATLNSVRVPANSLQPFAKGAGAKYLAVYCPGGSQGIVVHIGDGA